MVWHVQTIPLWFETRLSCHLIGCVVDILVVNHTVHLEPSGQFFDPWPDLPQFLQRCWYLHSASDFLQVLALNLLRSSGFSPLEGLNGFLELDPSEKPSTPSGMTIVEYSLLNLLVIREENVLASCEFVSEGNVV